MKMGRRRPGEFFINDLIYSFGSHIALDIWHHIKVMYLDYLVDITYVSTIILN